MPDHTSAGERNDPQVTEKNGVTVRPFPWPYRAMLAICSDIDATTPKGFIQLHRFLNTREQTTMGQGLGLDVADSFWFYAPKASQMAFFSGMSWKERAPYAERILDFIRGGWIDTLHSYGNFSSAPTGHPDRFTREHAERALAVLDEAGLTVKVWSNHGNGNNIQNVGRGKDWVGDRLGHPCHHSNLMRKVGICFVWSGFMSAEFRQDVVVEATKLRDTQSIWRFSRQDCAYRNDTEDLKRRFGAIVRETSAGPMAIVWHPTLLHVQLSRENLAELAEQGGYAILGQHLGVVRQSAGLLPREAVAALRRLKAAQDAGDILVARTSRLLEYAVTRDGLRFESAVDSAGKTAIDIRCIEDAVRGEQPLEVERLRGISFEVTGDGPVELCLRGTPIARTEIAEHRLPEKQVIGIRWHPSDHTDYAHKWTRREVSS